MKRKLVVALTPLLVTLFAGANCYAADAYFLPTAGGQSVGIAWGWIPEYTIPLFSPDSKWVVFRFGNDVRKVVETGILPQINTGIAHKDPGVGMVQARWGHLNRGYSTLTSNQGSLKLLNLTKKVHDLLQITKLYTVFDVHNDERSALTSFK